MDSPRNMTIGQLNSEQDSIGQRLLTIDRKIHELEVERDNLNEWSDEVEEELEVRREECNHCGDCDACIVF